MNNEAFQFKLKTIKPGLGEPLQFEYTLYEGLIDVINRMRELSRYKTFHKHLINSWNILDKDGTHPNRLHAA